MVDILLKRGAVLHAPSPSTQELLAAWRAALQLPASADVGQILGIPAQVIVPVHDTTAAPAAVASGEGAGNSIKKALRSAATSSALAAAHSSSQSGTSAAAAGGGVGVPKEQDRCVLQCC